MGRIENIIKNNAIINKMYTFFGSLIIKTLGIFVKKDPNLVLFVSYMGKNFNDSPKAIYDAMRKDPAFSHYELCWAFKSPNKYDLPYGTQKIKIDTLSYFIVSLKAGMWITNVNIERGLHYKKKNTLYINTWHGIPLKKIGNDVSGRSDFDFSAISYFPYSGEFEESIYKRAFNLNDNNLKRVGMPRNDVLINGNNIKVRDRIDEAYNTKGKTIILYAPTWRDTKLKVIDANNWIQRLGDNYVIFVRSHGLSKGLNISGNENIVDVSDYEETVDLLIASDLLVTDYSSIMFDYSLTEKPIFIYGYDYDEYAATRGTYFDIRNCGLNFYEDEEELLIGIKDRNNETEQKKSADFKNRFFDYTQGNATTSILEYIKKNKQ